MPSSNPGSQRPKLFAYYFPDWHTDSRNASWFGAGWSEWRLVEAAQPRFPGHRQPRRPAGGTFDEASGPVGERQIQLAADHGIDGFLVDFYWYDDGPYLHRALDDGLLCAPNLSSIEFALMWANHDLTNIFPAESRDNTPPVLKAGRIDRAAFDRMVAHIVSHYFTNPHYLRIDGRAWFSIYELGNLISGLGGVDETRAALQHLENEARRAGLSGVHLDAVVWGLNVLPGTSGIEDPGDLLETLGFRSATSYVWIHHSPTGVGQFADGDWAAVRREAFADYERLSRQLPVPFYPNVTVGWDSTPRTSAAEPWSPGSYPWLPVWDAGPDEFRQGLEAAREHLATFAPPSPLVTLNAWNEWTEGSYLLPDGDHGNAYLEAVQEVFPPSP